MAHSYPPNEQNSKISFFPHLLWQNISFFPHLLWQNISLFPHLLWQKISLFPRLWSDKLSHIMHCTYPIFHTDLVAMVQGNHGGVQKIIGDKGKLKKNKTRS